MAMPKTDKELAVELAAAGLAAEVIKSDADTTLGQGDDVASAFRRIYDAISGVGSPNKPD